MQVNLNCNNPKPQFGMAFRMPKGPGDKFNRFAKNLGLENSVNVKGLQQYTREQAKNLHFDVVYTEETPGQFPTFNVVDNETGRIMERYTCIKSITGFDHFGITRYPFRKILGRIINPKQELPYGLLMAGEKATELEKAAIQKAKLIEKINNI